MPGPSFTQPNSIGYLLGCVLNPKTLRPSLVYSKNAYRSGIQRNKLLVADAEGFLAGTGAFAEMHEENNESFIKGPSPAEAVLAAELTGYPRASKVEVYKEHQGQGYATVVYTALALAAWMNSSDAQHVQSRRDAVGHLGMNVLGPGISSNFNRSTDADVWWDRAKELGIAYEEDIEVEGEVEEYDVTIPYRRIDAGLMDALGEALTDHDIYSVQRIDDIRVSGRHSAGGHDSGTADVYKMFGTHRATGAMPLILFTCSEPFYEEPSMVGGISPLRHVPELKYGGGDLFNKELAPLLNLADTNVYVQNAIREVYAVRRRERLFEHIREETIGARYDVSRGYLENRSVPKSNREAYEQLNLAAYAELPG